jgi:hypothetical protein
MEAGLLRIAEANEAMLENARELVELYNGVASVCPEGYYSASYHECMLSIGAVSSERDLEAARAMVSNAGWDFAFDPEGWEELYRVSCRAGRRVELVHGTANDLVARVLGVLRSLWGLHESPEAEALRRDVVCGLLGVYSVPHRDAVEAMEAMGGTVERARKKRAPRAQS